MKSIMNKLNKISVVLLCLTALMNGVARAELPDKSAEIMEHLKFLGYSVELFGKNSDVIRAANPTNTLLFSKYKLGMMVAAIYKVPKEYANSRNKLYKKMNEVNKTIDLLKIHYDNNTGAIFSSAVYTGIYQKKLFANFINEFNDALYVQNEIMTNE